MEATLDPVAAMNALVTPTGYDANKFRPQSTQLLGIDTICPSPCNPRKHFDDAAMTELIESVKKHGVLEPILVRCWPADYTNTPSPLPMWEIVAGERRWRAAKAAGMQLIEAKVRHLTDHEMLEIMLVENLQREGLHPIEEAEGYERMMQEYQYTAERIADKVGKSPSYVYARLKLTALCHEGRKAFYAGKLNASTALLVARVPVTVLQEKALREITDPDYNGDTMSVREAQYHLQRNYMLRLNEAPFPINDPDLVHAAGKCDFCPKRTGNAPDLFDDVESPDVCIDPECYDKKRQANIARQAKAAQARGIKVILGDDAEKIMPYGKHNLKDGFVALDETCYQDTEHRTYRQLIGEMQPAAIVEDHRSGAMVEVVEKKQMAEALAAAGIKAPRDLDDKKATAMAKAVRDEGEFRKRLHQEIRASLVEQFKTGGPELNGTELAMIGRAFYSRSWDDIRKRMRVLWGFEDQKNERHGAALERAFATFTPEDWCLFLIDLCLIGELSVASHSGLELPENLTEVAKSCAIDPAELKKQVAAEARAKVKTPTKAAQAGGPKRAKKAAKAPAPTEAAPAGEEKRAAAAAGKDQDQAPAMPANEKPTGAAPAADETPVVLAPVEAKATPWPFPTAERLAEIDAAQAADPKAKKRGQACLANEGQSRKVINEKPSEEEPLEVDPDAPARCDRTVDMFEEAAR